MDEYNIGDLGGILALKNSDGGSDFCAMGVKQGQFVNKLEFFLDYNDVGCHTKRVL